MSEEYMLTGKMNRPTQAAQNAFSSAQNESMLDRIVYQDFQRRIGNDLNDKQKQRLLKTVRHYMEQVSEQMPEVSLREKNARVLEATVPDFIAYLQRSQSAPPVQDEDASRMDVATRFNKLQNERNAGKSKPPAPPEFRLTMEEEGPTALSIFEQVKKARDDETLRGEQLIVQRQGAETQFQDAQNQARVFDQSVIENRERSRITSQRESANEMASRFVSPDPRRIFMKDILDGNPLGIPSQGQSTTLESLIGNSGLADANMTLALPEKVRIKPALSQDTIIRQDDILAYKENEYNLFVYSADRDWLINKNQNRYNFTVNFDPANNGPGQTYAPSATVKFKNITRIELVKTILPIEGLDIIQKVDDLSGSIYSTYGTALNTNVLSFPYLNVYIPELDNNNFGTDYYFNQAFASLQYDANWVSDNNTTAKGGYLAMIPKFLKCQKVYTPTPLATLKKLSIQIQRPDGCLVSETLDTLQLTCICTSAAFSRIGTDSTLYAGLSGQYLFIQTSTYFSRFMVNQGDRIRLGGVTLAGYTTGAASEFLEYVQRPEGHLVVQIAFVTGTGAVRDGVNEVGYGNVIIIRSKMNDPTTGSTSPANFGGSSAANSTLQTALNTNATTPFTGALINLSHQTTLVFRVITRDLDPATRIRPDNL